MRMGVVTAVAATVALVSVSRAAEKSMELTPSGFAYFQIGQVNRSWLRAYDHTFRQQVVGRFTLTLNHGERLKIVAGIEGVRRLLILGTAVDNSHVALKEAQGVVYFGDTDRETGWWGDCAIGYFPYKYNPDARDLGEYLMRSGTYPGYIITDFENAKYRALGLRASAHKGTMFTHDLLFTSETNFEPYYDYSLASVSTVNLGKVLTLGAGVALNRLIPVDPEKTTSNNEIRNADREVVKDSKGDTLYWSLRGTKLMGRFSFDPKPFIPTDFFRGNDLRLYSEFAVLGLRDIPIHYPNLLERMPVMAGFNIPTHPLVAGGTLLGIQLLAHLDGFLKDTVGVPVNPYVTIATPCLGLLSWGAEKLFDIDARLNSLAVEVEWYGAELNHSPISFPEEPGPPDDWASVDDFKWIIHARRTLFQRLDLIGLVGRDHYRDRDDGGNFERKEILRAREDLYFMFRLMFKI